MNTKKRSLALLLPLLALAALGAVAGCSSLDKTELEARLLELEKNHPIRDHGLRWRAVELELDGERHDLELTWFHAPAAKPKPGARPVVLVPGTPSTLFTWVEIAFGGEGFAGLGEGRDVYAIEVPGHGIAEGDLSPYTFDRCATFVAEAVRTLDIGPVHLVGSSYGGEFAWRAALAAPELVESLVLIDSSGIARRVGDFLPEEVEMRESSLAKWGWLINSRERITTALEPHFDVIPPDRVEEFFLVCENADNWGAMIDLARDENGDREAELSGLRAPTLLLWGEDDVAYDPEYYARRFAAAVPRSELRVLHATGHYPHEQRPAVVIEELRSFFEGVER